MICLECRKHEHGKCADLPRLTAAKAGKLTGVTDQMASRWCDCAHLTETRSSEHAVDRVDC
jgi:hypothetical protein